MSSNWLFDLRGPLTKAQTRWLMVAGIIFFILVWMLLSSGEQPIIDKSKLPHPQRVLKAFGDLYHDNELFKNIFRSIGLNLGGYIKAIIYGLFIGFAIGLVPMLRGMFQKLVDAVRFLPLTAVTGLFILWFGIYAEAKINFLAFGIFIYLLPVVIQRIDEVDDVYLKTVQTLGASYWQTIKTVYWPSVVSRLSDDIRILTAISWTYIIVAETSADQGGVGSLIYAAQRLNRVDKIFALLVIIMGIGVIQDRVFTYLDRKFFPFKYQLKDNYNPGIQLKSVSLIDIVVDFIINIMTWILLGIYVLLLINEFFPFMGGVKPLEYMFGDTLWTVHTAFGIILLYQIIQLYNKYFRSKT